MHNPENISSYVFTYGLILTVLFCLISFFFMKKKQADIVKSQQQLKKPTKLIQDLVQSKLDIVDLTSLISISKMNMKMQSTSFISEQRQKELEKNGYQNMDEYITKNHFNKNFIFNQ